MSKNNVDWVRALKDLEEAKKLQRKKRGIPAWLWFFVPVLLLFGWVKYGKDDGGPKTNTHGQVLGADGNYHTGRPAWEEAERYKQSAPVRRGQMVTVSDACWGYATVSLNRQASAAAGKHAETYAQFNREQAAQGNAVYFSPGERVVVVDVKPGLDTCCRVRRESESCAWWVLRDFLSL